MQATGNILHIARDPALQEHIQAQKLNLAWSVEWEVARSIPKFRIPSSEYPALAALQGDNTKGAEAKRFLREVEARVAKGQPSFSEDPVAKLREELNEKAFAMENKQKAPWEELDQEDAALLAGTESGLGCNPENDWYGGKGKSDGCLFSPQHAMILIHTFSLSDWKANRGNQSRWP